MSSSNYKVEAAAPNLKGFDANTKITAAKALEFYHNDYRFCLRYLSRLENESDSDLTSQEVIDILESGLALSAVQHVQRAGWTPSVALGSTYGQHAAEHAHQIGLLRGMNLWLDLEGVIESATSQEVIVYCQSWFKAVAQAGYIPGLYVGANSVLNSEEFYEKLSFQHYWKSLSHVPRVYKRGFQMIQFNTIKEFGISIDQDKTQNDELGGSVLWMVKSS